jgi:TPR repeat protein
MLRKSAEQGFDEAAWSLVEMYSLGQGVPQDDGEAAK